MKTPLLRIAISEQQMLMVRKYLVETNEFFICGSHSITWQRGKIKYLSSANSEFWSDVDGSSLLMTPSEIARVELSKAFPRLKRVGWQRGHIRLFDIGVPLLFTGQYNGYGHYIDLKAAYMNIYRRLPLNIMHPRGWPTKPLMLTPVADILAQKKSARNAVIGTIRSRTVQAWRGSNMITLSAKNRFLSPCLWATIQDILHEIAQAAVNFGAIYINTDGYIFPDYSMVGNFLGYLDHYGFRYTHEQGDIDIIGWNTYAIRDKKTVPYISGQVQWGKPGVINTLIPQNRSTLKWLKNVSL